jgi:phage gp29-like protein
MAIWSKITDWFGRPATPQAAAVPQTASLNTPRLEENHPARGLTLDKLAQLLRDAEAGDLIPQAELGEDMEERDSHLFAELSKRRRALVGLDWHVEPLANADAAEKRAAQLAGELIAAIPDFEDAIFDLADGILKGYSGLEITWQREGTDWLIEQLTHQPATRFCTDQATRSQLRLYTGTHPDGDELWPFGWIMHRHKAKSGYLARQGLIRILAPPYLSKVYGLTDLVDLLEIYGFPLALGKFPASATREQKASLLKAVSNLSRAGSGIIPAEMSIDLIETAKNIGDPHLALIAWAERAESKAILGATLTSEAQATGLGSNLASVHQDVAWDLTLSDVRQLAGTLTRDLVFPLLAVNLGWNDRRRCPRFVFDVAEVDDISKLADAIPKLVPVLPIPAAWVYRRTGIPQPQAGEAVLQAPTATPPPTPLRAALRSELPTLADEEQTAQVDRLAQDAAGGMDTLLDRIRALADEVADLPTLYQRLSDLYPDLDATALTEALADAVTAGALAGRLDVLEGR